MGNISASKIINVIDRNIKRKFKSIGVGTVNDKHTSDFGFLKVLMEGIMLFLVHGELMELLTFGMLLILQI